MSSFVNQDQIGRRCIFRAAYYNIWRGGEQAYPLIKTANVIRLSRANIVAIQEADGATGRLAELTGFNEGEGAEILTSFEVLQTETIPGGNAAAQIRLPNGHEVWVVRCHLKEKGYGPYEIRKGTPNFDVEANERASGRLEDIRKVLEFADRHAEEDVIILAGLNSPSHLDWTERTAERNYGVAVAWPVTKEIEAAGFVDAYRKIYPDEVRKLGYTWSPGSPAPKVKKNEKHDRVEFVFYRGNGLRVAGCQVVGEHGSTCDIVVRPWPSDHRIVVAEFETK